MPCISLVCAWLGPCMLSVSQDPMATDICFVCLVYDPMPCILCICLSYSALCVYAYDLCLVSIAYDLFLVYASDILPCVYAYEPMPCILIRIWPYACIPCVCLWYFALCVYAYDPMPCVLDILWSLGGVCMCLLHIWLVFKAPYGLWFLQIYGIVTLRPLLVFQAP